MARIVAIADEYCNLTLKTKTHTPVPNAVLRENFIKEAGERFDLGIEDVENWINE